MIILYQDRGVAGFFFRDSLGKKTEADVLKHNAIKLLNARGEIEAGEILHKVPFDFVEATTWEDEFYVLYAKLPIGLYEKLRNKENMEVFKTIAKTVSEIGWYTRAIAIDLEMEIPKEQGIPKGSLSDSEISKVVYNYIGVNGGYLGDFSYRTHKEFYIDLDIPINPFDYDGTTRERFMEILKTSSPEIQAKMLEGILVKYPAGSSEIRTQERYDYIQRLINRLQSKGVMEIPTPRDISSIVCMALADADQLISSRSAISGVDRMHTALHGYLRHLCAQAAIEIDSDSSITEVFKALRTSHPGFQYMGSREEDITKVIRALATIIDTLNPIRNRASVAHPNEEILDEPEAILIINAIRTLISYFDVKL